MSEVSQFAATVSRLAILDAARSWIGTPYVHQASAKGAGCDCLGLIRGVWREVYGEEPETPPAYTPDWNERHWKEGGGEETLLSAARRHLRERRAPASGPPAFEPGDVLIFRIAKGGPAKHCGLVTASDRFIHAYAGRRVAENWLNRWWRDRIAGVFIYPGAE